jgi:hypothetical protein
MSTGVIRQLHDSAAAVVRYHNEFIGGWYTCINIHGKAGDAGLTLPAASVTVVV